MHHRQADESSRSVSFHVADKRVVTIGGGTGPFALLSHLKDYPCAITAVVTMADSGGSSRRLMDEFGQLPFGDLRQALVALSRKGALWRDVFTFRFGSGQAFTLEDRKIDDSTITDTGGPLHLPHRNPPRQTGVGGHSLGNLIISALESINEGRLLWALEDAQELLSTAGRVLPVTFGHATLCAELVTGEVVCGESEIDIRGDWHSGELPPIQRIFLREDVQACEEAIHAIRRADVLVLGPGDLYTSILPNLLVGGIAEAICSSSALKVYICNLMTKHGETDGFAASDFVCELHRYLGGRINRVLLHDGSLPAHLVGLYAAKQQHPVQPDVEAVRDLVNDVVVDDFLAIQGSQGSQLVRHNPNRLIEAIFAPLGRHIPVSTPMPIEAETAQSSA